MTHLNIQQGSNVEIVSALVIKKLYDTALTVSEPQEGETDAAYMSGHISVSHTYAEYVEYLAGEIGEGNSGVVTSRIQNPTGRFQDLTIDVTNGIYIDFEDQLVESILATNFGDGVGITQTTVASITSFGGKFANSSITSFNELSLFTNITEINSNNKFNSCTSLTSIDLSNITKISGESGYLRWNFENCSNLEDVGDTSNLTYIGYNAFYNCSHLLTIDTSNVTTIGSNAFYLCTALTRADLSSLQTISESAFIGCSNVTDFVNLSIPNLTGLLGLSTFARCSQIINVLDLGTIDTIGTVGRDWDPFMVCDNLETIIVPETVMTINYFLRSAPKVRWVKMLCNTVPAVPLNNYGSFGESWNPNKDRTGTYVGKTYPIYVKDSLYNDYLQDSFFSTIASRIKPLSQFTTDFPNG